MENDQNLALTLCYTLLMWKARGLYTESSQNDSQPQWTVANDGHQLPQPLLKTLPLTLSGIWIKVQTAPLHPNSANLASSAPYPPLRAHLLLLALFHAPTAQHLFGSMDGQISLLSWGLSVCSALHVDCFFPHHLSREASVGHSVQ